MKAIEKWTIPSIDRLSYLALFGAPFVCLSLCMLICVCLKSFLPNLDLRLVLIFEQLNALIFLPFHIWITMGRFRDTGVNVGWALLSYLPGTMGLLCLYYAIFMPSFEYPQGNHKRLSLWRTDKKTLCLLLTCTGASICMYLMFKTTTFNGGFMFALNHLKIV